jgi:hypothetical protein
MSDNGSAMIAAEISEGLSRLGILHQTTLPYSPYQNGKQEAFWGSVEGRLMAMLDYGPDLTLSALNEATQAWVEHDYNRKIHSEMRATPVDCFLAGPSVLRDCPDSDALRLAFTRTESRTQRRSDGTIVINGRRFAALLFVIVAAAIFVWTRRWPQALFDWLTTAAMAYLFWSAASLHRWDLVGVSIFQAACIARAELHRNGVAMPRMWWRDE